MIPQWHKVSFNRTWELPPGALSFPLAQFGYIKAYQSSPAVQHFNIVAMHPFMYARFALSNIANSWIQIVPSAHKLERVLVKPDKVISQTRLEFVDVCVYKRLIEMCTKVTSSTLVPQTFAGGGVSGGDMAFRAEVLKELFDLRTKLGSAKHQFDAVIAERDEVRYILALKTINRLGGCNSKPMVVLILLQWLWVPWRRCLSSLNFRHGRADGGGSERMWVQQHVVSRCFVV